MMTLLTASLQSCQWNGKIANLKTNTYTLYPLKSWRTSALTVWWSGMRGNPPTNNRRPCSVYPFQWPGASVLVQRSNTGSEVLHVLRVLVRSSAFSCGRLFLDRAIPGPTFIGRPRSSLPFSSRMARSAPCLVATSTKQYDGFLPV